ncbi:MAG: hemerythrin family protein [Dorea sp.]|nr:hemerythrin family protein [Dorea sp.]
MTKYELTKDLETGNAMIDQEHRELFGAVNRLFEACSKGQGRAGIDPAVQFLLGYVDKHFAHEERLQQTSGYPNMAAHKTFHAGYKKTLKELAAQLPAEGATVGDLSKLNKHIAVLISHIRNEDKRLGEFLK